MTIIALVCTKAATLKMARNTGKPAGPEPIIFIGNVICTTLPLPACVDQLGASIKTQFGTIFVGSLTTRKPVTAVNEAVTSSMA